MCVFGKEIQENREEREAVVYMYLNGKFFDGFADDSKLLCELNFI